MAVHGAAVVSAFVASALAVVVTGQVMRGPGALGGFALLAGVLAWLSTHGWYIVPLVACILAMSATVCICALVLLFVMPSEAAIVCILAAGAGAIGPTTLGLLARAAITRVADRRAKTPT